MRAADVVSPSRIAGAPTFGRRALLALIAWAGAARLALPASRDAALAGKRARRRKQRKRRAQERICQAVCGASCAACRQRCAVCNDLQVCFHLPNATQPLCKVALTPDNCELCSTSANCDKGAVCVKGQTFAGVTIKIPDCEYAFGVCMEEFP